MKKIVTLAIGLVLGFINVDANAQTEVRFFTNHGTFDVMIHNDIMPITGGNFLELVDNEFYDDLIFHRVIEDFVIQGGDPTGTGTGGPGYAIDDEFHESLSNVEKTISMANSGPNTGGSQFFFNMIDNTFLDPDEAPLTSKHPVFGEVIENWDIVEEISKVDVNGNNKPLEDVVIDSIRRVALLNVNELDNKKNNISIYPNPVSANSIVEIHTSSTQTSTVDLYDCMGTLVSRSFIELEKGVNTISVAQFIETKLPAGIYFFQLEGSSSTTKLLVD